MTTKQKRTRSMMVLSGIAVSFMMLGTAGASSLSHSEYDSPSVNDNNSDADLFIQFDAAPDVTDGERVISAHQLEFEAFLEDHHELVTEHRTYEIANAVHVEANNALLPLINELPYIADVMANDPIPLRDIEEEPMTMLSEPASEVENWHLDMVNAPDVWADGYRGEGITIGIIDTGVAYDHPALMETWRGYEDGVLDADYNWYDPIDLSPLPNDQEGHGTQVLSLAMGHDREADIQLGMATDAEWIAARGLNEAGFGTRADILSAGEFLLKPTDASGRNADASKRPDIIINSWGTTDMDERWFEEMIESWLEADIFPVFAGGNRGPEPETMLNPAVFEGIMAAGNVNRDGQLAENSSRGPGYDGVIKPDVVAPGMAVSVANKEGDYGTRSGTSMAAPQVAGLAAVLWAEDRTLAMSDLQAILRDTATPMTDDAYPSSPNMGYGYGLLNASEALREVVDVDKEEDEPEGDVITGNVIVMPGRSVTVAEDVTILGDVILKGDTSSYDGPEPRGRIVEDF